jgi:predicted glutamine amidotransferase
MSSGPQRTRATFWLLDAPDSLAEQSRRNPDGYGIGTYEEDGTPEVDKRPAAAYADHLFAREAREEQSTTFVAHVRYASTGGLTPENTHPFEQDGRLFAHNGHIAGLDRLEQRLGPERELVHGDTDSERFFALITKEVRARDGDVAGGIAAAVAWVAGELPLYALNFVMTTRTDVWALRYPETHPLLMLERATGGPSGRRHLDASGPAGTIRVRAGDLATSPAVIFATEQMDEDSGWSQLQSGELVHVDEQLNVQRTLVAPDPPRHQLRLDQLAPHAAASQAARSTPELSEQAQGR